MVLEFKDNANIQEDVVQNDTGYNILLWMTDDMYEEFAKRSDLTKETGKTFWDVADSDEYFTAYFNIDNNGNFVDCLLEFEYHEYNVPLTETEIKSLMDDLKNQAEQNGLTIQKLIEEAS